MASFYRRSDSPFFWIKFRDPITGKIRQESSGIRLDFPEAKQRVRAEVAERTRRELMAPKVRPGERWTAWAGQYLDERYSADEGQRKTARIALRELFVFFAAHGVLTPRMLTYTIAAQWMAWRLSGKALPKIHHNTARLRWVYLSVLCGEALRRGMCEVNVCRSVRVGKIAPKPKQEITAEHEAVIESALATHKPWMREQWLVLMRLGCRISETYVPLARIDEGAENITLRLKGGRLHTTDLHPDLLPLFALARAEGRKTLIEGPPSAAAVWSMFFRGLGLPYSAHCTRVTVITRLLRAGHSPALVCTLIGHSEEVNVLYRRLRPADARVLRSSLSSASGPR